MVLTYLRMFTDENAFGILISYYLVENEEYGLDREQFVGRFELFRRIVRGCLREAVLATRLHAVDLGHAFYVEVAEGEQTSSPLAWARRVREMLHEHAFDTVAIVTHGSRWVDDESETALSTEHVGNVDVFTISNPSEPLRRALYGEAASHPNEGDGESIEDPEAWGPGLYLDTEAAEALAMVPKNAPTILYTRGAGFYRVGR